MIRKVHILSVAAVAMLAAGGAMAASERAAQNSRGAANANPMAGGFSNPSSVLYDNVSEVPEPATLALAGAGAAVLLWARRRGRK